MEINDKIIAYTLDEIKSAYKAWLNTQNLSASTVVTSATSAFYIWNKCGSNTFWNVISANDFEIIGKNTILELLKKHSNGNAEANVNGYMAHLRRFRRVIFGEECTAVQIKTCKSHRKIQKSPSLSTVDAIQNIEDYFNKTLNDKHGRYMSWQHCYTPFISSRNANDEKTIDYLALHMAFYLASWGMYRGSSFLLRKDYKVHKPIVKIIMKEKYNPLAGISAEDLLNEKNLDLIDDISNELRKAYAEEQPSFDGVLNNATDTLVTKILLAAFGCVPAFDRYYVQAVKKYGISSGRYNRNSVKDAAKYYIANQEAFETVRERINTCGTKYPPMKLVDMCMWQAVAHLDSDGEICYPDEVK